MSNMIQGIGAKGTSEIMQGGRRAMDGIRAMEQMGTKSIESVKHASGGQAGLGKRLDRHA